MSNRTRSLKSNGVPATTIDDHAIHLHLFDTTLSRFHHRFGVRVETGPVVQVLDFPAAFDRDSKVKDWCEVLLPNSFCVDDPALRRVVFAETDSLNDQIRGCFLVPMYFDRSPVDRFGFRYDVRNAFARMADGNDCVFVDIFQQMSRVSLRISGEGFSVRPNGANPNVTHPQTNCAEMLKGFDTDGVPISVQTQRMTDGREGVFAIETNVLGLTELVWSLVEPQVNTRYKIFFQADPAEKTTAAPLTPAVRAHDKELDRLFGDYHHGRLDAFAGKFLLAAGGRILDHDEDAFALRERAAAVARAHGVPIAEVVEFLVPSPD